jgi:Protein of unknown function (DUF1553)
LPSIPTINISGEGNVGQNVFEPVIRALDSNHRSVYLPRVRGALPEVLELFDAPDASLVAGSREQTSSPLQSLYLMNNPFVQRQAEELSQRVAKRPPSEQIEYAYLLALGRKPREEEKELAKSFMNDVVSARLSTQQKLTAYCQALICTTEFSSLD